jgi:DNA-binding MarR family transcriptional regulator
VKLSDSFATIASIKMGEHMDRTDQSLIALRRILRATEVYGRDLARAAGLTAVQFRVLQIVGERGLTTATEIARRMRVSQATVTSLVDKLVRHGMVKREKSQADRRQINILITDRGRETISDAPDALQQRYVRRFEAMKDWEQAQLIASLERVAAMLDATDIDASPVLDTGDLRDAS